MSSKCKMSQLRPFMTEKDEEEFSVLLRAHIPEIKFICDFVWGSPEPPIRYLINQCEISNGRRPSVILLNESIYTLTEYKQNVREHLGGGYYKGGSIGHGIIQFEPSEYDYYAKGCLSCGGLVSSYRPEETPETGEYIKLVWKLFKSRAIRVYQINRETGEVSSKPDSGLYAWPDAASKFDGKNNHYLAASALDFFIPATSL
ncbi:hypothetical protein ACT7V1_001916 [Salmonella enterica subsp. enterica]|nr:hypothetical protein [Salmonella enterica subsp. enterica serovar Bahati]ECG3768152.1 hypothetical protein [Salmonella enterica subsp. enterica serovar Durham]EGQ4747265.1 hypothetical protein [Salmonella enterica subsp. enterica serovar Durham]EII2593984.1 hypothetical protein [Salmonella enterica]EII2626129.1 hypothetical protein [Salmonella enterica]